MREHLFRTTDMLTHTLTIGGEPWFNLCSSLFCLTSAAFPAWLLLQHLTDASASQRKFLSTITPVIIRSALCLRSFSLLRRCLPALEQGGYDLFLVSALLSPVILCCKKHDRTRRLVGGDSEMLQEIYDGVSMALWAPCAVACPTAKVPPAAIDKDIALTMGK